MRRGPDPKEITLAQVIDLQARYVAGDLSASEFSEAVVPLLGDEFSFWCSYTPESEMLKPLFADRDGVEGLLERYRIEQELERIEPGTSQPYDFATSDDCIYASMRETASFRGGPKVTFDVILKFLFASERIRRIEMFLDGRTIDAAYPATGD